MRAQSTGGIWPVAQSTPGLNPEQIKTLRFLRQAEMLHRLFDLTATLSQERVKDGLIQLLKNLDDSGAFPGYLPQHAHALLVAALYGLDGNPKVREAFLYAFRRQRPDGGWLDPIYLGKNQAEKQIPSCIWTTLLMTLAISHSPGLRRRAGAQRAVEFLKQHFLERNSTGLLQAASTWDLLGYGYFGEGVLHGGTLRLLEIIMNMESPPDKFTRKIVDWLKGIQLSNGYWPAIVKNAYSGDSFVTVRVLRVIKYFTSPMLIEIDAD